MSAGKGELAHRLNRLFDEVTRPGTVAGGVERRRWTNEDLADEIKKIDPATQVSGAYISMLRRGDRRNPSLDLLKALGSVFGVPTAYFLDQDQAGAETHLAVARLVNNHGVRQLATRASDLTPQGLAAALAVVEAMLQAEGRTGQRKDSASSTLGDSSKSDS